MQIKITENKELEAKAVVELYRTNEWSAASKPKELLAALRNSHALVSAWDGEKLVGLGNSISDGHLVVYYPHLLVLPDYQGKGVGRMIMEKMFEKYGDFHMQMLTADGDAIDFYEKMGFSRAGKTEPMWIYAGSDH